MGERVGVDDDSSSQPGIFVDEVFEFTYRFLQGVNKDDVSNFKVCSPHVLTVNHDVFALPFKVSVKS